MSRRHARVIALATVAALAVMSALMGAARAADEFPNRPVRIVVPQATGAGIDLQARVLAQKLGALWGQPVVVENRPGANAIIGTGFVAKSPPDGYTLVYAPITAVTTNAFIYKSLPYDPLRDFAPITQTVVNPMGALANPASGIKSIQDLVARARAKPGDLNYGSFGIGNLTHLMGVMLSSAAGIKMTHVPYKGQTPEMTDLIAGQIPVGFTTMAGAAGHVEAGKLDLIATFGKERDPQFPNTPTVVEAGFPGVVVVGWAGVLAPAGVPAPIIAKLHAGFVKALDMPDVKEAILRQGSDPASSKSPEDFARFIRAEMDKFRPVVQAAGLEGSE
ncbi:MAG TPA: tripartite tricarboxylate transporter substrate binding protein [Xanthobacteraceae bacterium]|nr:tripartite tricarboxylate transporter substrate binding protein [Xanthobacteraceae bacterium]